MARPSLRLGDGCTVHSAVQQEVAGGAVLASGGTKHAATSSPAAISFTPLTYSENLAVTSMVSPALVPKVHSPPSQL